MYILVTKVPVTGRADRVGGGRRGATDSSSPRKIPEPTIPIPAAVGAESDIYGCESERERRGTAVYVSDV